MQTTSEKGIALVKKWEKPVNHTYTCPAGKLTIGVGHLITDTEASLGYIRVKDGTKISINRTLTDAEMDAILASDLEVAEMAVRQVKSPLTQNQFDALVVFVFNAGVGKFFTSTLRKVLDVGLYEDVPTQLRRWKYMTIKGKKVISQGLINRREDEIKLFTAK